MSAIQPIGGDPRPQSPAPTQQIGSAGAARSSSAASVGVSSSISVTMVHNQVSMMLQNIGQDLQNNQLLRMMIGLLILQALLAQDGGSQKSTMEGALDILRMGVDQRSTTVSMHSATNVLQIQQHSQALETSRAPVAPTSADGDPNSAGQNVDLSA